MKVSLYLVDPRKYLPSLTPSIRSLGHFVCMEIEKCDIKMGSSDALGRIWQVNGEEGGLQLIRCCSEMCSSNSLIYPDCIEIISIMMCNT